MPDVQDGLPTRRLCTRCRYVLAGLDDVGRCPECGEPFDPAALTFPAWRTDRRPVLWLGLAYLMWMLAMFVLLLRNGPALIARGEAIQCFALVLLALASVLAFGFWWANRRRAAHGEAECLVILDDHGIRLDGARGETVPWTNVRRAEVRRAQQPFLRLRSGPWYHVRVQRIALDCSWTEANAVADEINRRARARTGTRA